MLQYSTKHGRTVEGISAAAIEILRSYDFPGNARELANILERAVIVANSSRLDVDHLPPGIKAAVNAYRNRTKPLSLAEMEQAYIADMLVATGGNKSECARILGISRKNLYEKIATI